MHNVKCPVDQGRNAHADEASKHSIFCKFVNSHQNVFFPHLDAATAFDQLRRTVRTALNTYSCRLRTSQNERSSRDRAAHINCEAFLFVTFVHFLISALLLILSSLVRPCAVFRPTALCSLTIGPPSIARSYLLIKICDWM